uniref:Uncharacterized protein n=1 Tax=Arundo donax TaxID=35708 RepID=A0A0A9FFB8_ARUDO
MVAWTYPINKYMYPNYILSEEEYKRTIQNLDLKIFVLGTRISEDQENEILSLLMPLRQ